MIHSCNVHCHALNKDEMDLLGIDDKGKWLPFSCMLDDISAIKVASDDEEELTFNCTTVFTRHGETFIIDTLYKDFLEIWKDHIYGVDNEDVEDDNFNL